MSDNPKAKDYDLKSFHLDESLLPFKKGDPVLVRSGVEINGEKDTWLGIRFHDIRDDWDCYAFGSVTKTQIFSDSDGDCYGEITAFDLDLMGTRKESNTKVYIWKDVEVNLSNKGKL